MEEVDLQWQPLRRSARRQRRRHLLVLQHQKEETLNRIHLFWSFFFSFRCHNKQNPSCSSFAIWIQTSFLTLKNIISPFWICNYLTLSSKPNTGLDAIIILVSYWCGDAPLLEFLCDKTTFSFHVERRTVTFQLEISIYTSKRVFNLQTVPRRAERVCTLQYQLLKLHIGLRSH